MTNLAGRSPLAWVSPLLATVALLATPALTQDCELEIDASLSSGCPSTTNCPPFQACQKYGFFDPLEGENIVICTCGGTGPVPWCCQVGQFRASGVPTGVGSCDPSVCSLPPGDCHAKWDPALQQYVAVCE